MGEGAGNSALKDRRTGGQGEAVLVLYLNCTRQSLCPNNSCVRVTLGLYCGEAHDVVIRV